MASENLKDANSWTLAAYVFVHALVVAWVTLGFPVTTETFAKVGEAEWPKAGVALVVTMLVTLFNGLGGHRLKATLVYWRIRDPLPSARAFTELARTDPRIDSERLQGAVGGRIPTESAEQNRVWFRLYRAHADTPSVASTHKDYLLLRDITWLTALVAVVDTLVLFALHHDRASAIYLGASVAMYFLARVAAKMRGERFVLTVLACASAAAEPITPLLVPEGVHAHHAISERR